MIPILEAPVFLGNRQKMRASRVDKSRWCVEICRVGLWETITGQTSQFFILVSLGPLSSQLSPRNLGGNLIKSEQMVKRSQTQFKPKGRTRFWKPSMTTKSFWKSAQFIHNIYIYVRWTFMYYLYATVMKS